MYRQFRRLALSAALLVLAAPAAAHAAAIEENATWLSFSATSGEVNDLTVSQSGASITFDDPGKTIDTTAANGLCGAASDGQVTCTPGARQLKIDLADGDDRYASTATIYTKVDGGDGDDTLTGGPAVEKLDGALGDDTLDGGLGDDKLYGGADSDELTGGGGIDELSGDAGTDRIFARDGASEFVSCGADADFATVDPLDLLAGDCETIDDGVAPLGGDGGSADTPAPPQVGRNVTVAPARGVVRVRTPGGRRVVLRDGDNIPVGSLVDTTRGAVTLTSAADARGKTQTAQFSHGAFQIRQKRGPRPITELVLKGRLDCAATRRGSKVVSARGPHGRKKRRLWGSGKGRFRTRGRRSSATVRGTIWMSEDRCNGTYTKVKQGVVAVRDFRTGRTKLVRAGKSHFAKRSAAKRRSRR